LVLKTIRPPPLPLRGGSVGVGVGGAGVAVGGTDVAVGTGGDVAAAGVASLTGVGDAPSQPAIRNRMISTAANMVRIDMLILLSLSSSTI
jgi:hypothetical protein